MNSDTIIQHKNEPSKIFLDGSEYNTELSVGLEPKGDFYVKIKFLDLRPEQYKKLAILFKEPRALDISADFFNVEGYPINRIVAENLTADNAGNMIWECLSDGDFDLEIK